MDVELTHNGKDVSRWLDAGSDAIEKGVSRGIKNATTLFTNESVLEAPKDTGRLKDGITNTIAKTKGTIFTSSNYAKFVHQGTKPHAVSASKLSGWAKRKGLNPYAVAKSIKKKGTKANPFFTRAVKKNKNKAVEVFSKEIDKAIDNLENT